MEKAISPAKCPYWRTTPFGYQRVCFQHVHSYPSHLVAVRELQVCVNIIHFALKNGSFKSQFSLKCSLYNY
jgi:hypothetical protein